MDLRNPTLVSFLDLSRWVAAAIVFLGHLRNPLFLGYGDLEAGDRTLWVKAWYFVTGLHNEAVIVFFVLSGLLVAGAGAARISKSKFDVRSYSVDRVTRLYLAFLPALLLGYTMDCFGSTWFGEVGFWDKTQPMIAEKISGDPFEEHLSPTLLLMNACMLQTFWCLPVGSNHPLWTISAEFWFYVVFGIAAVAWMTRRAARGFAIAMLIGVFLFLGIKFPVLLGYWLLGMLVAFLPGSRWLNPLLAIGVFLVVTFVARFGQIGTDSELARILKNTAVAASFAIIVVSLRGKSFPILDRCGKPNRFLADFSYSLYLIHFPLMLFLLAFLYSRLSLAGISTGYSPTDGEGLSIYFGLIIAIYLIAWLFSRLTEAHTKPVRQFIKSGIGLNPTKNQL